MLRSIDEAMKRLGARADPKVCLLARLSQFETFDLGETEVELAARRKTKMEIG